MEKKPSNTIADVSHENITSDTKPEHVSAETDSAETEHRRQSAAALNIIENPLMVSLATSGSSPPRVVVIRPSADADYLSPYRACPRTRSFSMLWVSPSRMA